MLNPLPIVRLVRSNLNDIVKGAVQRGADLSQNIHVHVLALSYDFI